MPVFRTACLLASLLLISCGPQDRTEYKTRTIVALGTLITVEIHGVDDARAEQALERLEEYFQAVQRDWYAFGDGELGTLNAALSKGEPGSMSPELANLTRRSLKIRELSDGLFDPTIGMLIELWGFDDADDLPASPPDDDAIRTWLERNAVANVRLKGRVISADHPVKLSFGAIAKGTALNGSVALLEELGIENALVSAGGDLKVLGRHGERQWRIGIRDPHSPGLLGSISLAPGEAIVTSGNYERFYEHAGRVYHHLLDPATGRPVTHTAGVTVLHENAELADAAATALMVGGAQRFERIATRMGIVDALLVTSDGDIVMTPAMAARIREPAQSGDAGAGIM